jgi:hypothetical protein
VTQSFVAYPCAAGNSSSICGGPDGNIWAQAPIVGAYGGLAQVTPQGAETDFSLSILTGLVGVGPDGNIWCSYSGPSQEGLLSATTGGVVVNIYPQYKYENGLVPCGAYVYMVGQAGAFGFIDIIKQCDMFGNEVEFIIPGPGAPYVSGSIITVLGSDGTYVYFGSTLFDNSSPQIYKMDNLGNFTLLSSPATAEWELIYTQTYEEGVFSTPIPAGGLPFDGTYFWGCGQGNQLFRMDTSGNFTAFTVSGTPSFGTGPGFAQLCFDGTNLWVCAAKVVSTVVYFPSPHLVTVYTGYVFEISPSAPTAIVNQWTLAGAYPVAICVGPNGIWTNDEQGPNLWGPGGLMQLVMMP